MIAPFEVVVVIAQQDDAAVAAAGERVYQSLLADGVEVIVDDRPVRLALSSATPNWSASRSGSPWANAGWPPGPPS